jgi:hypothetical protein
MFMFLKGAGIIGSLLVLIAMVITLVKTLIGFIGFLSFAIKLIILFAFLALFIAVGLMILKSMKARNHTPE